MAPLSLRSPCASPLSRPRCALPRPHPAPLPRVPCPRRAARHTGPRALSGRTPAPRLRRSASSDARRVPRDPPRPWVPRDPPRRAPPRAGAPVPPTRQPRPSFRRLHLLLRCVLHCAGRATLRRVFHQLRISNLIYVSGSHIPPAHELTHRVPSCAYRLRPHRQAPHRVLSTVQGRWAHPPDPSTAPGNAGTWVAPGSRLPGSPARLPAATGFSVSTYVTTRSDGAERWGRKMGPN
jgi:hypothetical protein